jgi:hypothetical protein
MGTAALATGWMAVKPKRPIERASVYVILPWESSFLSQPSHWANSACKRAIASYIPSHQPQPLEISDAAH